MRSGVVVRTTLLNRLITSDEPVITVVAPPGYGKTTLLTQWTERLGPRVAWVSCEKTDNDPVALWTAVITAVGQIAPVSPAASQLLATSGGGVDVIPSLVSTFGTINGPLVLVLDHTEAVTSTECRTSIAEFALRVPKGWRLAIASRDPIPIPMAQLRVHGRIVEIGTTELAMARNEASELLKGAGVELSDSRMDALLQRTEGWPAGLYLAALAMKDGSPGEGFTFTGDDRLMGDYLRSELLARVSSSQASFFMRTSVLDRMSGPLCDVVLAGRGSARVLEQLVSRNLLVVLLDRGGEWYRYHHLLRELLKTELRRNDPDLVPELHSRAAVWYEANGMPETAVEHARAAGDAERVARLVLDLMHPVWASGRVDTVRRWMEWLEERPRSPLLCHRRTWRPDLRAARAAERGRTLGSGRGAPPRRRDAARRQHGGCNVGVSASESVPRRPGSDAPRRPRSLGWVQSGEPLPHSHGAHRGPLVHA